MVAKNGPQPFQLLSHAPCFRKRPPHLVGKSCMSGLFGALCKGFTQWVQGHRLLREQRAAQQPERARSREAEEHGWPQVPIPLSCALEEGWGTLAVVVYLCNPNP